MVLDPVASTFNICYVTESKRLGRDDHYRSRRCCQHQLVVLVQQGEKQVLCIDDTICPLFHHRFCIMPQKSNNVVIRCGKKKQIFFLLSCFSLHWNMSIK